MKQKVSSQSVTFFASYILIQAMNGIIGFIAASLFRPIWNKITGNSKK